MKPDEAPWASDDTLSDHFAKHRLELGYQRIVEYDESARATIRSGKRFTYRDPSTGRERVGYYDRQTMRLTVLNRSETRIVTHFLCHERYVRGLPGSD